MRNSPGRPLKAGLVAALVCGCLSCPPVTVSAAESGPARHVIVELAGDAAVSRAADDASHTPGAREVAAARRTVADRQQDFLDRAQRAGVHPGSVDRLDLLVNAVSMTVPESEVAKVSALPGVAAVHPDVPVRALTDVSVPFVGAPQVWRRTDASGARIRGAGVTVAVIDTGIDYTHPDLGGGLGQGHKVVAGYDFFNDDADPLDDNGHGTHVAGIVAAEAAAADGITGVAPDAELVAYKAMGADGAGHASDIIAAIEAAVDPANPHRADVINLSLGSDGDGTDLLGRAASAAVDAGAVVVAAAGNSGPGAGTVGSPAAADGVIAVGASTTGVRLPGVDLAGRQPEPIQTYTGVLSAAGPAEPVTTGLVDLGEGAAEDWQRAGDVRGKAVFVRQQVPPDEQVLSGEHRALALEAERRGAVALIGGIPQGDFGISSATVPDGGVTAPADAPAGSGSSPGDGLRMDSLVVMGLKDGTTYADLAGRLARGPVSVTVRGTDATDRIAAFSSRGPSGRFGLKPDLVAPGVSILSTFPTAIRSSGRYRMSGTSMAAPHGAGAAALLRQQHPGWMPAEVRAALVGTARTLDGPGVTTQGAGRLDVAAAASTVLTAQPDTLSFGLADLSRSTVGATAKLTLHNSGTRRLSVGLRATGGARPDRSRVSVPPGGSATVGVSLSTGRPAADTEIGGHITAVPDHGPSLTVPYLLVVRALTVQASPDPSDGTSTVFLHAPAELTAPPTVRVVPPHGAAYTLSATADHGNWYRATVTGTTAGTYRVTATGTAVTGQRLVGSGAFEVTDADSRGGWQQAGPNNEGGELSLSSDAPKQAVLRQYGKAGPWLTTDGGATWSQLNRLPVAVGTGTLLVDPQRSERWWYAVNGVNPPATQGRILRTEDRGRTWRILDAPDTSVTALVTDEEARTLVAVAADGLVVSTDGGDTWTTYATGTDSQITAAAMTGDRLYLGTIEGDVWMRTGMLSGVPGPARKVYSAPEFQWIGELVADGSVVAASVPGTGVVASYDDGRTWSTRLTLGTDATELRLSGSELFAATAISGNHLSPDRGRTWSTTADVLPGVYPYDYDRWADGSVTVSGEGAGLFLAGPDGSGQRRVGVQGRTVHDLAAAGDVLLAATDTGVYRTSLPVRSPEWGLSGREGVAGERNACLTVSPSDPKTVWRIVYNGWTSSFTVLRSSDAGATWAKVTGLSGAARGLLVNPADPRRVAVAFDNPIGAGLLVTTDGGASWKTRYHDAPFEAMAGDRTHPNRLWLGNADGLYRSDDGGTTVTKVADGPVTAIEQDGNRLLVGGATVRVSTDGGRSFRIAETGGLPMRVSDLLRVGKTLYASTSSFLSAGIPEGGRGVLHSTDNGLTWTNISSGLQNLDAVKLAAPADGRSLYVATVNGGVHRLPLG